MTQFLQKAGSIVPYLWQYARFYVYGSDIAEWFKHANGSRKKKVKIHKANGSGENADMIRIPKEVYISSSSSSTMRMWYLRGTFQMLTSPSVLAV